VRPSLRTLAVLPATLATLATLGTLATLASLALLTPRPLLAQKGDKEPKHPSLSDRADTNDWQAYFQYGMQAMRQRPDKAADAFAWAGRLDPSRAEPLYAEWAARWMSKPRVLAEYFQGAEYVVNSADVQRLDSLYYRATLRNPFIHQSLVRLMLASVYDSRYGAGHWEWSTDPENLAWLAYTEGRFEDAARGFGDALAKAPRKVDLHLYRARALFMARDFDGTLAELSVLLDDLRKKDRKRLVYFYDSKAMFEYSAGITRLMKGDHAGAREAFGRALTEDLSFYMAHGALAGAALAQGDTAAALDEYALAVQIQGADPALRSDYGFVLLQARRPAEAAEQLTKAVALAPHYALPYYYLAHAEDAQQKYAEALTHYAAFVQRAPAAYAAQAAQAKERITVLNDAFAAPGGGAVK